LPGRADDLMDIPAELWQRAEMRQALHRRDIGHVFRLVSQYAGASQTQIAIACGTTQPKVSDIMRDIQKVKELAVFERIADGLDMPDRARADLGLAPRPLASAQVRDALVPWRAIPARDTPPAVRAPDSADRPSVDQPGREEDAEDVQRRAFVTLTGASLFGAVLASAAPPAPSDGIEAFAALLTGVAPDAVTPASNALDLKALSAAVARARHDYQGCRYSDVIDDMRWLLPRVQTACAVLTGDARLRACTLSADAHHVAASVLLKLGDQGLAWVAADRSMQAARASQDPITIGCSARIITHALMGSGHLGAATSAASTLAARLDSDVTAHSPESLSVYGSLLLRGAIAAARRNDRQAALSLLAEARDAGRRLGTDANLRWTAFGPVNVRQHQVHIAVTLGDAGTAIDTARRINLDQVTVTERKASLLIDTARAFLQCGRHESAYLALRAAEDIAPQEIAARPAVRQLLRDLITAAPPSVRRQAEEFANQLEVSR